MLFATPAAASSEDAAAAAAVWLEAQQNADGSWGAVEALRGLTTSEAVIALRAYGRRHDAYFSGVTWLENHALSSVDFRARRIVALLPHGDDLSADRQFLLDNFSSTSNVGSGWGLSGAYAGGVLDTALALQGWGILGVPSEAQAKVTDAVTFLVGHQGLGADDGWPANLTAEGAGDPVLSAIVLRGYASLVGSVTGYEASADLAVNFLLGSVASGDAPLSQAQAALALQAWMPGTLAADPWLTSLESLQDAGGSWDGDPYVTAVALQALAAKLGTDTASLQATVSLSDLGLRAALNLALGKNRVDAITRGEMLTLTHLDARHLHIEGLMGIQEAQNLESIILIGNPILDLSPLDALPNLTTIVLADACDVNADGAIGVADAQIALAAVFDAVPLTATEMAAADVAPPGAPEGVLTVGDALVLLRAAMGQSVPACGN